ncbi:MAG: hypothetical protein RA163_01975 [Arsenophonus sp.]|nr:MAG: hypothetical protein RA163_01975 [Arsenophonus sp.]
MSLYYLSNSKTDYIANKSSLLNKSTVYKSSLKNTDKANIDHLPPKPEERWHYIQELKKQDSDLKNLYYLIKSNINNTNHRILTDKQKQSIAKMDNKKNNFSIKTSYTFNKKKDIQTSKKIINFSQEKFIFNKKFTFSKQNKIKKNYLIIKCLSFKNFEKIESIKANLAFLGLESDIIRKELDYSTIKIGPYNQEIRKIINNQLKSIDLSNCILHNTKG